MKEISLLSLQLMCISYELSRDPDQLRLTKDTASHLNGGHVATSRGFSGSPYLLVHSFFFFFNVYPFLRDRNRAQAGEGQRENETQNPKQAPDRKSTRLNSSH